MACLSPPSPQQTLVTHASPSLSLSASRALVGLEHGSVSPAWDKGRHGWSSEEKGETEEVCARDSGRRTRKTKTVELHRSRPPRPRADALRPCDRG
ncbi:hypothetical protein CDD83_2714 [Cordyceps sp. RAO-2017]|nr:hypothetical protein CDD83_2714 [Cordyceps sp. RAO-2017]